MEKVPRPEFLDVDPRTLRLPGGRVAGADPYKLQKQIATFGTGQSGMTPPWVYRGSDGELMLSDGVTRATRIARLCSGDTIRVEVIGTVKVPLGRFPTVGDTLP